MKRILILALFLMAVSAKAQVSGTTANRIFTTTVAPTSCAYSVTADPVIVDNGILYVCSVGNVYVAVGGGAGFPTLDQILSPVANWSPNLSTYNVTLTGTGTWDFGSMILRGNFPTSGPPQTQYIAPQPVTGCGVEWTGLLNFTVGPCTYTIGGVTQMAAQTNLTLTAADVTNPRIELIFINGITNTITFDAGTPAPDPAVPVEDPSTTIAITSVYVGAGATVPSTATRYDIYHTDSSDWACSKGGTNSNRINCTSTNNPYDTTQTIEFGDGGTVGSTGYAQLQYASTLDVSLTDNLIFYIRNKAAWPSTRNLTIQFYSTGTAKGTAVILSNGAFGFNATTNTTSYQQIVIPSSAFGAAGVPVNQLRIIVSGSGTALTGFYVDDITLQGGIVIPPVVLPTTLMNWRGTWSATTGYKPNDTVVSGGVGWVALIANTNVSLATASTWAQLGPLPGFVARQVSGSSDTFLAGDNIRGVVFTSATAVASALPTPATLGISNYAVHAVAAGAGTVTVTPASSLPVYTNGNSGSSASTLAILPTQDCLISMNATGAAWDAFCTPSIAGMVTASTPAAGLAHFAGSTNALTSVSSTRAIGYSFGDASVGSALTNTEVGYVTVPFACTITGWRIMADAGTVTIKTARVATGGTALPTIGSNSISTNGVQLSSGTLVNSTTVTDFTSLAIASGDTLGFFLTTVATAKQISVQLDCSQ